MTPDPHLATDEPIYKRHQWRHDRFNLRFVCDQLVVDTDTRAGAAVLGSIAEDCSGCGVNISFKLFRRFVTHNFVIGTERNRCLDEIMWLVQLRATSMILEKEATPHGS